MAQLWNAVMSGAMVLTAIACVDVRSAEASVDTFALNGTYQATSNGEWAQSNDSYHDEHTVRSIWTITSTCTDAFTCSGTISSDQGWTAAINKTSQSWTVEREVPNWEPCADGTAAPGRQVYRFFRVDAAGAYDLNNLSAVYAGEDKTTGPSGACGISRILAIKMPFRLEKLG